MDGDLQIGADVPIRTCVDCKFFDDAVDDKALVCMLFECDLSDAVIPGGRCGPERSQFVTARATRRA